MRSFISLLFVIVMTTGTAQSQNNMPKSPRLIQVSNFDHYQPIGVGISKTGRTFVTFPRRQPHLYSVSELVNGQLTPYPNAEWNSYDSTKPRERFMNAQAAVVDEEDNLWLLDPSNPGEEATVAEGVKLLKVNLGNNRVEKIYRFEDLPREKIALNDVRIDTRRNLAYLSEPKTASIVVLDLATGKSRMVLINHYSTKADKDFKLHLDGKAVIDTSGKAFSSNVNGIALTKDGKYFYYRAINQTKLYRISTEALANAALNGEQLGQQVEIIGETGVSHGMIADARGNIFTTDSPEKAIRYITPEGRFETLVRDSRLIWPDTYAIGPDGYLYLTCSQINRAAKYNDGEDKTEYPYRLYKIKLP